MAEERKLYRGKEILVTTDEEGEPRVEIAEDPIPIRQVTLQAADGSEFQQWWSPLTYTYFDSPTELAQAAIDIKSVVRGVRQGLENGDQ